MIITLKNKTIKTFVDSLGSQKNTSIDIGNTSINFGKNITIFHLEDDIEVVENFSVVITGDSFTIAYRDGLESEFIESLDVSDTEVRVSDSGGKQIRKFNIFCLSDEEGTKEGLITISYNKGGVSYSYEFSLRCDVVGIDPKYIVLAQNFKFDITQDYYKAFKDSEHRASEVNELLLNEKRKEFLISYFDLTAQVASYHTLLAALHYFGYGDLLSIRELWNNENGYRQSTKITTEVQDHIDNRLLGFTKTNQLQLVYQINEEDGTEDSDGFENYINVLFDTEEMLIKMYALKRVLEKDFLPLNTKIVDIIGEHTSTLGVDVKIFLNDERIDEIDLNNQSGEDTTTVGSGEGTSGGGFDFESGVTDIEISEHEVLLLETHFNATDSGIHTGEYPEGVTKSSLLDNVYFEIEKVLEYDTTTNEDYTDLFSDNDFVQKYDRSDYGLVKLTLDINREYYSRWSFEVFDMSISETEYAYKSDLKDISELNDDSSLIFGVRKLGEFKVRVYAFDYYGGVTWMNPSNNTFNVVRGSLDFKLARIDRDNNGFELGMSFWSTSPTSTETVADRYVEIDAFDDTLDINTFDEENHNNLVLRYQSASFDQRTLQMNTFQFNNVGLNELAGTALTDYGYEYGKFIIDVIGDGTDGFRILNMRNFESKDWDSVSLEYDSSQDTFGYLSKICSIINTKGVDSVWNKFTATIQYFSYDLISDAVPVIRIVAKEVGISIDNVFTDFSDIDTYNPLCNFSEDYYSIMPISGLIRIHPTINEVSDLVINGDTVSIDYTLDSTSNLTTTLRNYFSDNDIKASVWDYDTFIIISTRVDLSITHDAFGTQMDVARGKESSILKLAPSGDNFYKGEPFYAYVDLKTRLDGSDFFWTLTNALTGEIIDEQKSYVYRNLIVDSGSYSLELTTNDIFGSNTKVKNGFVIVD